jgi:hypothetical protein
MDPTRKAGLIKSYRSIESFARETTAPDFVWGIADYFGYERPADLGLLPKEAQEWVILSLFCKEFLSGGFRSVFEHLPEFLPALETILEARESGRLSAEFAGLLRRAREAGLNLNDDEDRWSFIEEQRDFRAESQRCQPDFIALIDRMRSTFAATFTS